MADFMVNDADALAGGLSKENASSNPGMLREEEFPKTPPAKSTNEEEVVTSGVALESTSTAASSSESEEEKLARELDESEALARMLMAEEAQHSFEMQLEFIRSDTSTMSQVDLVAVQALLR